MFQIIKIRTFNKFFQRFVNFSLTTGQQEIPRRNISEFGFNSIKSPQTTLSPFSTPSIPADNPTSVSLIQVGNIKRLTDGQMLIVGTITLINDQGYRILVDTGSAADTEALLQGIYNFLDLGFK